MILMTALAGIVIAAVVTGTLLNRPPPNIPQVISTRAAAPASLRHAPPAKTSSASAQDRVAALAERGDAKAEALQGLEYAEGRGRPVNEAEGAKWLERAALQGEAIAAWRLGSMYERGHGVPADPAKAVQWYRVAAKAGNRKAMHNLAIDYVNGTGVTKDFAAAAFWFARAASLGLADSEFNLGVLYERGLGVPQSLTDAYKWYAIAAAQGDAESKERLSALATQISPGDRVAAEKAAADFRPANPSATANSPPDPASVTGG
jgi:localization factor PodJL